MKIWTHAYFNCIEGNYTWSSSCTNVVSVFVELDAVSSTLISYWLFGVCACVSASVRQLVHTSGFVLPITWTCIMQTWLQGVRANHRFQSQRPRSQGSKVMRKLARHVANRHLVWSDFKLPMQHSAQFLIYYNCRDNILYPTGQLKPKLTPKIVKSWYCWTVYRE